MRCGWLAILITLLADAPGDLAWQIENLLFQISGENSPTATLSAGMDTRNRLKLAEGSIQDMVELPQNIRDTYRTAWELPMSGLIDMAAGRGAFIDQSQSLNLFVENPNIGPLSSMYFYAWKKGLKTTYYLRSRPATRIAKATVETPTESPSLPRADTAAVACSLENPETCEACQ